MPIDTGSQGAASTPTPLDALRRIPWLAAAPASTLEGLAAGAMVQRAPAGIQLFEQADIPAFVQILLAGEVELLAARGEEEILVELLRPVELVLPAAALGRLPYLVRARVRRDAQLLLIGVQRFRRALAEDHALCLATLACQGAQFRRQMKILKAARLRPAEARLAAYLLALCAAEAGPGSLRLPASRTSIASELGMTRETLSRTIPAMARIGLHLVGDTLEFEDLARARATFPFDPSIDGPEPIEPIAFDPAPR